MATGLRWTEEQLEVAKSRIRARPTVPVATPHLLTQQHAAAPVPNSKARVLAVALPPKTRMNKTESAYAGHLEMLMQAGEIVSYSFEVLLLFLGAKTFYHPDFFVQRADGVLEIHEVKGFWRDDARVKIKTAANRFPMFRFIAVTKRRQKDGGGWVTEEFSPC